MLFRVVPSKGPDTSVVPATLAPFARLGAPDRVRTLTLNEVQGTNGPLALYLDGTTFMSGNDERPVLGTTEDWEVVNMTADTHPIHLHLVQFQVLNRQRINLRIYEKDFRAANPVLPAATYIPVPPGRHLKGRPAPPDPNEVGWKDTARMNPGEVTRIRVRFAPQEGGAFAFDATAAPGYVWHCHILEHEENDMMHRLLPVAAGGDELPVASTSDGAPMVTAVAGIAGLVVARPNPSRGAVEFGLTIRHGGPVALALYDAAGHRVRTLVDDALSPGELKVKWDGRDARGLRVAAGIYFARLSVDGAMESTARLVRF